MSVPPDAVPSDAVPSDAVPPDAVPPDAVPASSGDGPVSYALLPRPQPSAEVLAVLALAVDEAWPRPAPAAPGQVGDPSAWRFSGRWWSGGLAPGAGRGAGPSRGAGARR